VFYWVVLLLWVATWHNKTTKWRLCCLEHFSRLGGVLRIEVINTSPNRPFVWQAAMYCAYCQVTSRWNGTATTALQCYMFLIYREKANVLKWILKENVNWLLSLKNRLSHGCYGVWKLKVLACMCVCVCVCVCVYNFHHRWTNFYDTCTILSNFSGCFEITNIKWRPKCARISLNINWSRGGSNFTAYSRQQYNKHEPSVCTSTMKRHVPIHSARSSVPIHSARSSVHSKFSVSF
jgi:hypothetical protein